ncbi:hypothetical protein LDENG_00240550 [Lucifuga dentata]|nr:hypothetical protein LDENG_00240550 [Lucifuga dentata]
MEECLQSGFVTLPRISRLDRQCKDGDIRRASLPDDSDITLTRSDSLTSFTVDLGPSLMAEVLSLIDNSRCLLMSNHNQNEGEEREDEEDEESSSVIKTPVQTPETCSPNPSVSSRERSCSSKWTDQEEERRSLRIPDVSSGCPRREEPVMEAERFQRAADVLSRHYGGGSFTKGRKLSNNTASPVFPSNHKTTCDFSEEEEEIKV